MSDKTKKGIAAIQEHNSMNDEILQDFYTSSKSGKKKQRPWRDKKMQNELLALAYDEFDSAKAARLKECGRVLVFREYKDGTKKLDYMNSCRVRLCPLCSWRRSLKNFYNNLAIADYLDKHGGGKWLALTLTVKSVGADQLADTIDMLFYSFRKFVKNTNVAAAIKGFYRGLEITHDCNYFITRADYKQRRKYLSGLGLRVGDLNPTYDCYHPHFHVLFHVDKDYFSSVHYLRLDQWLSAWKQALGVDYLPSIKLQRVRDYGKGEKGSIAEISKYSVKSSDYIYPDDWDLSVETVKLLDSVLANRRLIGYGGDCMKAKRALKLQDADSGDLVNVDASTQECDTELWTLKSYFWCTGYNQYCAGRSDCK